MSFYYPSFTQTVTFTPTNTVTGTPTSTGTTSVITETTTSIFTQTATNTMTQTQSNTRTFTPTGTPTSIFTQTATNSQQPTFTSTPTNTVLQATHTQTPEITSEKEEIKIEKYQNPYNPEKDDLKIKILVKFQCKLIKVKIYTTSFRLIKQITYENNYAGEVTLTIDKRNLNTLTNGIYYLLITGMNKEGKTINSKPINLIILR